MMKLWMRVDVDIYHPQNSGKTLLFFSICHQTAVHWLMKYCPSVGCGRIKSYCSAE